MESIYSKNSLNTQESTYCKVTESFWICQVVSQEIFGIVVPEVYFEPCQIFRKEGFCKNS